MGELPLAPSAPSGVDSPARANATFCPPLLSAYKTDPPAREYAARASRGVAAAPRDIRSRTPD